MPVVRDANEHETRMYRNAVARRDADLLNEVFDRGVLLGNVRATLTEAERAWVDTEVSEREVRRERERREWDEFDAY